jgi:hypothetical protein
MANSLAKRTRKGASSMSGPKKYQAYPATMERKSEPHNLPSALGYKFIFEISVLSNVAISAMEYQEPHPWQLTGLLLL